MQSRIRNVLRVGDSNKKIWLSPSYAQRELEQQAFIPFSRQTTHNTFTGFRATTTQEGNEIMTDHNETPHIEAPPAAENPHQVVAHEHRVSANEKSDELSKEMQDFYHKAEEEAQKAEKAFFEELNKLKSSRNIKSLEDELSALEVNLRKERATFDEHAHLHERIQKAKERLAAILHGYENTFGPKIPHSGIQQPQGNTIPAHMGLIHSMPSTHMVQAANAGIHTCPVCG
jgi:hypothetical protein